MKIFLSILAALTFSTIAFSQTNGGRPTGTIYGRVVDASNGKGIDAATVQLFQNRKDSVTKETQKVLVSGALASASGDFKIEGIPAMGKFILEISGLGHKTESQNFAFSAQKPGAPMGGLDRDLGNIKLKADAETLEGVTVNASKPTVQLGIDRKIYNVENNLVSAGGTATDVLRTVPSVNVDIDGNVSVRNASPQLFIDGRPTELTLDQIPADQIASVEVITNPSAKYDASGGTAGILNIVLKKTRTVGYNGSVRAGIDERGKFNLGGNINVRQGKFNVFANAALHQRKSMSDGTTERNTFLGDTTIHMLQTDHSTNNGRFMFGRAGFDYFPDNRNTITISGMGVNGKFHNLSNSNIGIDSLASGLNDLQSRTDRLSDAEFQFKMMGGSLGYVHNFPKKDHQLTADARYDKGTNNSLTRITNQNFENNTGVATNTYRQQQEGNGTNERLNAQIDYTNPLSENSKFETGVRVNQSKTFSENNYSDVQADGSLLAQPLLSSKFDYTDRVYAGYVNFASKIGENFGYQIGLRLESSEYTGTVYSTTRDGMGGLKDTVSNFSISYPVSLFPSIFLSQQLPNDQTLQLNYSRRINRPNFFQLFPFVDYSDSLDLSRGNPELKPEFVNSFELSYSKNFDRANNLILSIYYKSTSDLITRYQAQEENALTGDPVIVNTYLNANNSYVGGFEAIGKNSITKWWELTSNLNLYTSKITVDDPEIPTADQLYSWFAKVNNTFKLPKNFSLQLSADYNSKTVLAPGGSGSSGGGRRGWGGQVSGNAQGYSMPSYGVDMALKYEFLKNNAASITLNARDIFKTRASDVYTTSGFFNQHQYRVRDQQFFSINFAYRFGKFDASLLKRKNMKADQGADMGGGMQGGMQ
ncbi:outer membrane beta-barrel family protein [Niabella terrae]